MAAAVMDLHGADDGSDRPRKRPRLENVVPALLGESRGHQGRVRPPLWVSGMAPRGGGVRASRSGGRARGFGGYRGRGSWQMYGRAGYRGRGMSRGRRGFNYCIGTKSMKTTIKNIVQPFFSVCESFFLRFKGTGTRDLIWLKVVSLERS